MAPKEVTFGSIVPQLFLGLLRGLGPKRRRSASRISREIKVAAGSIPGIAIHELAGMQDVTVTTRLKGGAIVASIAKIIGAKQIFEFGTYLGETTMEIAQNCPEATVVTLDLPDSLANDFQVAVSSSGIEITDRYLFSDKRGFLIAGDAAARIRQIREDSAKFDPAPFLKKFDLIYIDASHSYSAVKCDSEKAFQMLKDTGVIVWDDYCYPGIWKYLNELAARRPDLNLRYIYDWDKVMMLPR